MTLTRYEQETIINYNDEEKMASVFTHNKSFLRKINEKMPDYPDIKLVRSGDGWAEYSLPKKWIKIGFPRQLSDEQKAEMANRMRNMRRSTEG